MPVAMRSTPTITNNQTVNTNGTVAPANANNLSVFMSPCKTVVVVFKKLLFHQLLVRSFDYV